jgi:hypothetical protein
MSLLRFSSFGLVTRTAALKKFYNYRVLLESLPSGNLLYSVVVVLFWIPSLVLYLMSFHIA